MENDVLSLDAALTAKREEGARWVEPLQFDMSSRVDRSTVSKMLEDGEIGTTHDRLDDIANDLFELRHPDKKEDDSRRERFVREIGGRGIQYGQWFYFGWDKTLVRYPDVDDFRDLKTFRNKNIVTDAEQTALYDAKVAVFGLSVGSSVADQLTMSGIGGTQILADFDTLAPSNLNRIRADFSQVGMSKIDIAAQKISKADPYIRQIHLRDGVTTEALESLHDAKPDIIYDEIDDLAMKALIRRYAAVNRVPVVMATDVGDTSLIDVERYDLHTPRPFNGRLSDDTMSALQDGVMGDEQKRRAITKLVGVKNASPRLIRSLMDIGTSLAGMPQLGTTATMGGSLAAVAGREIIVGRKLDSGRYVHSVKETLKLSSQTTPRETAAIFAEFLRKNRAR